MGGELNHAVSLKMSTLLYWPAALSVGDNARTQVNTGSANNGVLVIAEFAPLSPEGFIGDHTLMSGNQKAEDGRCALERQIGSKVPTGEK